MLDKFYMGLNNTPMSFFFAWQSVSMSANGTVGLRVLKESPYHNVITLSMI